MYYDDLLDYALEHELELDSYAVERTLIDHYISSDPNLHITEILIPIMG
jgi:effector-binding domain-containing protein